MALLRTAQRKQLTATNLQCYYEPSGGVHIPKWGIFKKEKCDNAKAILTSKEIVISQYYKDCDESWQTYADFSKIEKLVKYNVNLFRLYIYLAGICISYNEETYEMAFTTTPIRSNFSANMAKDIEKGDKVLMTCLFVPSSLKKLNASELKNYEDTALEVTISVCYRIYQEKKSHYTYSISAI